ncbi:MAG: hypothetical protein ABJC39_06680 [Chloroflexota bacterium]
MREPRCRPAGRLDGTLVVAPFLARCAGTGSARAPILSVSGMATPGDKHIGFGIASR